MKKVILSIAVVLLGLSSSFAFSAEISLKDCDNLSDEMYFGQGPALTMAPLNGSEDDLKAATKANEKRFSNYELVMKTCESLRADVKCDKVTRGNRSEAIFYYVNREGQIHEELADLVTAEMICSRQ